MYLIFVNSLFDTFQGFLAFQQPLVDFGKKVLASIIVWHYFVRIKFDRILASKALCSKAKKIIQDVNVNSCDIISFSLVGDNF